MATEKEWTPEAGLIEVQEERAPNKPPQGLKRSYRKGGKGYKFAVSLDGHAVYCDALKMEIVKAVADADRAFVNDGKRIQRETGQKKLSPEQAQEQSFAMIEARQQAYYEALKPCVLAWDLPDDDGSPLPLDVEILEFADAVSLLTAIQRKSTIGAAEESF